MEAYAAKIYGLADPATGELRYVGKTHRPLVVRLNQHAQDPAKGSNHNRHLATRWARIKENAS